MAALLSAKDLCKTYVIDKRQNNVLKNINLEVNEGGDDRHYGTVRIRQINTFVCDIRYGSCDERTGHF